MILQQLTLLNYKNLADIALHFSPKMNCFIGRNGVGKTNVLDAIYYLSFCKSATNAIDSQVIKHDADFLVLLGEYTDDNGDTEHIYCGLKRGHKKQFKRNKKDYKRLAEHIGLIPLVMVSPADTELITGGSEERRRFLDMVISQYDTLYVDTLLRYNKALQQRNALLRQDHAVDEQVLALFEETMAIDGTVIYQKRTAFMEEFLPLFQQVYTEISQGQEQVELLYTSHGQRGDLLDVIRSNRAKDRILGYSLHGIHKDELEMKLCGYAMKREGSQGQNKTFLISLKLAQFEFLKLKANGRKPLLLLDDIFDKLDATRVEQIVRIVSSARYGQIFITDTNRQHLDKILAQIGENYRLFQVREGGTVL